MTSQSTSITSDPSSEQDNKETAKTTVILNSPNPQATKTEKVLVKQLNPQEVRWFYKSPKNPNWVPFRGRDSLIIELKWRTINKESIGEDFPGKSEVLKLSEIPVAVLDDLYKIILDKEPTIKAIYWKEEPMHILRGMWFYDTDCYPLASKMGEEIERQHLNMFMGVTDVPSNEEVKSQSHKSPLHTYEYEKSRIHWMSVDNVVMHISNRERSWQMCLRLKSNVVKLRRGYIEEAQFSDGPLPINHLMIVVHGIGHKCNAHKIVRNTTGMRSVANYLTKSYYPNINYRIKFLPVEWRTSLKLDEKTFHAITIPKLQLIRDFLHTHALDIMYYCSPKYRSEVTEGMVMALNRIYYLFTQYNPNFEEINGEVSIFAHSLGSVICYDVITGWSPLHQYEAFVDDRLKHAINSPLVSVDTKQHLAILQNARKQLDESEGGLLNLLSMTDSTTMQLSFDVKNLFCVGSPISVFLALRGQVGTNVFTNKTPILYNIFHPVDPVACRLEPLIHPLYAKIKPLRLYRFDQKNPTPYAQLPMEQIDHETTRKKNTNKQPNNKRSWRFNFFSQTKEEATKRDISLSQTVSSSSISESFHPSDKADDDDILSQIPSEERLPYRMDYAIKESGLEFNVISALNALRCHNVYWMHQDVIMFILSQIYRKK